MIKKLILVALLLMLALACASAMSSFKEVAPTLRLINNSGDHVRVYVDGRLLGTATERDECFYLRFLRRGPNVLSFRSVSQQEQFAPAVDLHSREGWSIELNRNWSFDVMSLWPAERCRR